MDALLGDYRTASAQDTQTQAAIAGALLAYRTGPDQDVFTTNQITSALVAYRSAALLSYYTIAQVDGLLAGKLGVTEAASALQIAVRFPLPARHGLQLCGVHVRGRQRLRPIVRQLRGRPGRLEHFTVPPNGVAKLHFGAHFQAPGLPNQTAGTVDVYGLRFWTQPWRHGGFGAAAEARVP